MTMDNYNDENDFQEGLATLFLWWYGNHRWTRQLLRTNDTDKEMMLLQTCQLRHCDVEDAWRRRWFAKGDLTETVDKYMKENFGWMLEYCHPHDCCRFENKAGGQRLWERMAWIVLLDQVPRNVHRGTPQAYAYDSLALSLALDAMKKFPRLPFCFQDTIAICLCHSESMEMQELLASYVQHLVCPHEDLARALHAISKKHFDRVAEFGRFPERNANLNRTSTVREEAYLSQLR